MNISDKFVCWQALITLLVLLSRSASRATSCWNIRFWLRNKVFVDLHDGTAHHMRVRRIAPFPSAITALCLRVTSPCSALPMAFCSQKHFGEVARRCQKYPGRLANEPAAGVKNVLCLFRVGDQHIMNHQVKIQSPLWAPTSKGTTFQLAGHRESVMN